MSSAWNASAKAFAREPFDPNDIITKKKIDDMTVSTFGVVPDIILFDATAREACVPRLRTSSDVMDDPIQRLVC